MDERFLLKLLLRILDIEDHIDRASILINTIVQKVEDDQDNQKHKYLEIITGLMNNTSCEFFWTAILENAETLCRFVAYGTGESRVVMFKIIARILRGSDDIMNAIQLNIFKTAIRYLEDIHENLISAQMDRVRVERICTHMEKFFELLPNLVTNDQRRSLVYPSIFLIVSALS
jgi:hypothetical protein